MTSRNDLLEQAQRAGSRDRRTGGAFWSRAWNLFKFFVWLMVWLIVGAVIAGQLERSFVNVYFADNGFYWVRLFVILGLVGAAGSYWLYVYQMGWSGGRTRLRAAFAFHLGAFILSLFAVGIYALFNRPVNSGWLLWLAGWGIVVAVHGILARHIGDAPEDVFV